MKKEKLFFVMFVGDAICAYWSTYSGRFFKQYNDGSKAKRISGEEFYSAYDCFMNY